MSDETQNNLATPRRLARSRSRGVIFVFVLAIVVVLAALLLSFSQSMRVEALASGNRMSTAKADAIETGAEQWVCAQCDEYSTDAVSLKAVAAEALPLGDGYFWILRIDPTQNTSWDFGIDDEAGKLNLNYATALQMLNLPGITDEAAYSIADWVDTDDTPGASGAESSTYGALAESYVCKNAHIETPDEILLVNGVTTALMYGQDLDRNGVIDSTEQAVGSAAASSTVGGSSDSTRGFMPFVTCFGAIAQQSGGGAAKLNISFPDTGLRVFDIQLTNFLANLKSSSGSASFTDSRIGIIVSNVNTAALTATTTSGTGAVFRSLGAFYTATQMTPTEFASVVGQLNSPATANIPKMNVMTASAQALACLPGMDYGTAQTLVAARPSTSTDISWVLTTLSQTQGAAVVDYIGTTSNFYSADIVAASGDGRSFKRVRIAIDNRQTPARIIYRRDLTSLGWPLDPTLRTQLASGQTITPTGGSTSTGLP